MFKVLFICTDNVGRSLTAEYLLRDYLARNQREDIVVASAGTDAGSDIGAFALDHLERLRELGIDASDYERTQVTRQLILEHDLAVVMDLEQKRWVREELGIELPLYNEVLRGESTSVLIKMPEAAETMGERLVWMVGYFQGSIPQLIEQIDQLAERQRKNGNQSSL